MECIGCGNVLAIVSGILGGLFTISEILAFVPKIKSNSILHLVLELLATILQKKVVSVDVDIENGKDSIDSQTMPLLEKKKKRHKKKKRIVHNHHDHLMLPM